MSRTVEGRQYPCYCSIMKMFRKFSSGAAFSLLGRLSCPQSLHESWPIGRTPILPYHRHHSLAVRDGYTLMIHVDEWTTSSLNIEECYMCYQKDSGIEVGEPETLFCRRPRTTGKCSSHHLPAVRISSMILLLSCQISMDSFTNRR